MQTSLYFIRLGFRNVGIPSLVVPHQLRGNTYLLSKFRCIYVNTTTAIELIHEYYFS